MFTASIPKSEHANVMSTFWLMMVTLETHADNSECTLDRVMVEQIFNQWNTLMDDNKQPRWVGRKVV
jgi:hypothetical protein